MSISDDAEGNIKAVLGEEISDVVETSAPTDAPVAMAVTPTKLAVAVSSAVAVATPDFVLGVKRRGEWIAAIFYMSLYIL